MPETAAGVCMKNDPEQARIDKILKILKKTYPEVKTQLEHETPFQLLVATILSAQCTDKQVNRVTQTLFSKLNSPETFAAADPAQLEDLIRPTGYYRNKARNIQQCAAALVERHGGRVPDDLDALVKLPGVGRKTANVVLGAAFGIPGIVVDTHVKRISRRLGFTRHKDPVKIEVDLMAVIPRKDWNDFSLHLIYFGRQYCMARKPACPVCPLLKYCPYEEKTPG
jgi:endonuclease-3